MKQIALLSFILPFLSNAYAYDFTDNAYVSAKIGTSIVDVNDSVSSYQDSLNILTTDQILESSGSKNLNDGDKSVFLGTLAYGVNLEKQLSLPVRAELEYTYRDNAKFDSTYIDEWQSQTDLDITSQNLLLNFYYDLKNTTRFTPYISAGLGLAHNKLESSEDFGDDQKDIASDSKTNFSWAVGVGVNYNINKNLDLDMGYRYVDLGKVSTTFKENLSNDEFSYIYESKISSKFRSQDITLGLRYKF